MVWVCILWYGIWMVWYASVSSVVTGPCHHYYRQHLPTAWCGTVWFSLLCFGLVWYLLVYWQKHLPTAWCGSQELLPQLIKLAIIINTIFITTVLFLSWQKVINAIFIATVSVIRW